MTAAKAKKRKAKVTFSRPDNLSARRKAKKKLILVLFILLILSLGLSGYFAYQEGQKDNTSAALSIEAKPTILSGDEVVYKIFYQNIDIVDLTQLSLSLTYPKGFSFASASLDPLNEGQNYWEMEDLPVGFESTIEVRGRLIGDEGDQKTVKAVLAYEPANFSSTFTQEQYFSQEITGLKVDMWVDKVEEAMPGQQMQFRVHLLNKQTDEWRPLMFKFSKPDEFQILATKPTPSAGNHQWEILELAPEQENIITVMGELAPTIDADKVLFVAELYERVDGQAKLLDEEDININIINPDISVGLVLDDAESAVVNWGEVVNYELIVKNEGDFTPSDLRLVLVFDTGFINWQAWQDSTGLYREDNRIIWNKDHPKIGSKLASLQPNEEIVLKIGAKLQSAPIDYATLTASDLTVASVAKIESDIGGETFVATSDIVRSRIGQSFDFAATARYYNVDGAAVGSGPLPPQVGKTTTYLIEWRLAAGPDNWSDISLNTTLPPYIIWLNDQEGYSASFDSGQKRLSIDTTALNASEELTGSFFISVTPDQSQVGQSLVLLNPMTLSAVVRSSGETIERQIDLVSTNLTADPQAEGKSRVVE